jgi:hypothetical protein
VIYTTSDGVRVHINRPSGHYLGQVRRAGYQKWETVTGKHQDAHRALAAAVLKGRNRKRARVLFIDHCGYYDPHIVMEATLD